MVRWDDDAEDGVDSKIVECGWTINGLSIVCWGSEEYRDGFAAGQRAVWSAVRRQAWIQPVWILAGFLVGMVLAAGVASMFAPGG